MEVPGKKKKKEKPEEVYPIYFPPIFVPSH